MISLKRTNWFSLLLLLAAVVTTLGANPNGQESPSVVRQRFIVLPAFRPCDPAHVKMFALGNQPLEAILAEVTVENRSEKIITAMTLRWTVYDEQEGQRISLDSCSPGSVSPKILLTGTTDSIQLTSLRPKETSTIGINPLPAPTSANQTVFVERPFVTVDDVKSLVLEHANRSFTKYALVISVSEIQYNDGTKWIREAP